MLSSLRRNPIVMEPKASTRVRSSAHRRTRNGISLLMALAGVLLLSGCMALPTAQQISESYGGDGPDPALAPDVANTHYAFIYSTNSTQPGGCIFYQGGWNIPSLVTVPGTAGSAYLHDALPTLPIQAPQPGTSGVPGPGCSRIWAPTVRYINGQYLMMFAEPMASDPARGDCIGAAKSSDGITFTPINTWTFCSGDRFTGFLDPYLFSDPHTGATWLLYSRQWWNPDGSPNSEIDSIEIDAPGIESGADNCPFAAADCGLLSSNYFMLAYQDVSGLTPEDGNSRLENPAIIGDPYNGYDLVAVLG